MAAKKRRRKRKKKIEVSKKLAYWAASVEIGRAHV